MKIGLIAMSGKPVTAGHWSLISTAAEENDEVLLFVSLSDRARKGQLSIRGEDMSKIWNLYLEPALPGNVKVIYGGSPIGNIYEYLGKENDSETQDVFQLYSDPGDLAARFSEKRLTKYIGNLWKNDQIILRPISRTNGVDISGTQMREFLTSDLKDSFMQYLPPPLSDGQREEIWDMLVPKKRNEHVLRVFTAEYLKLI